MTTLTFQRSTVLAAAAVAPLGWGTPPGLPPARAPARGPSRGSDDDRLDGAAAPGHRHHPSRPDPPRHARARRLDDERRHLLRHLVRTGHARPAGGDHAA